MRGGNTGHTDSRKVDDAASLTAGFDIGTCVSQAGNEGIPNSLTWFRDQRHTSQRRASTRALAGQHQGDQPQLDNTRVTPQFVRDQPVRGARPLPLSNFRKNRAAAR